MGAKIDFLSNIECEYKYALNKRYSDTFITDFCSKFNELVELLYKDLPSEWASKHSLEEFKANAKAVRCESLSNDYFDTKYDELFRNYRMGLRLRRSDKSLQVEQTIKFKSQSSMPGASHTHLEFNVKSDKDLKTPDLSLFDKDQLPEGIEDLMADKELLCKYQTNFTRQSIVLTVPFFVSFEIAVDQGSITSGQCVSEISEVEFELKSIDPDYLERYWGNRIFDLDDIRFEFSSLINELLLLVAGAPTVFVDTNPDNYKSITLSSDGKYIAAPDLDNVGFECGECTDLPLSPCKDALLKSMSLKAGGLIGMEPLSKLRRAVLLKAFVQDNPNITIPPHRDDKVVLSVDKGTRVDFELFRDALSCYRQAQNPTIELYNHTAYVITDAFTLAIGLANLFGTYQHLEDVKIIVKEAIDFACNHKKFRIPEQARISHRTLCQDPELNDLSMLIVNECSSMYLEFNVKMWFEPFFIAFNQLYESGQLTLELFKELTRTMVNNSQSIKTLEYIERASYILRRKSALLCHEMPHDYKSLALATQYHMRLAWDTIKVGSQVVRKP